MRRYPSRVPYVRHACSRSSCHLRGDGHGGGGTSSPLRQFSAALIWLNSERARTSVQRIRHTPW